MGLSRRNLDNGARAERPRPRASARAYAGEATTTGMASSQTQDVPSSDTHSVKRNAPAAAAETRRNARHQEHARSSSVSLQRRDVRALAPPRR
jgi:hypothetical protein